MKFQITLTVLISLIIGNLLLQPSNRPATAQSVTPTATGENNLRITGRIIDATTRKGLEGARVGITSCHPRTFSALTDASGSYNLLVPASYNCGSLPMEYSATGYLSYSIPDGRSCIAALGIALFVALQADTAPGNQLLKVVSCSAQLLSFTADSPTVKLDGVVRLRWKTINTPGVSISYYGGDFDKLNLPSEGSLDIPVATLRQAWSYTRLTFYLESQSGAGLVGANSKLKVDVTIDTGIVIHSFTVEPSVADWNQTVTVSWNITGATKLLASAWESPVHGADTPRDIPNATLPIGTWQFTIPEHTLSSYTFVLVPVNAQGWSTNQAVTIKVRCPHAFMFPNPPNTRRGGAVCPYSDPQIVTATYQLFEHGLVIRRYDTPWMYMLFENGTSAVWSGMNVSPPDNLGRALQPQQTYFMASQEIGTNLVFATGGMTWILSQPDGRLVILDPYRWEFIDKADGYTYF